MSNIIELHKKRIQNLKKETNSYHKAINDIDRSIYEEFIDCGFITITPPKRISSMAMPMNSRPGVNFMMFMSYSNTTGSGVSIKPGNIVLNFKKLMASIPSVIESSMSIAYGIPILKICAALNIFAKLKNTFVINTTEDQAFVMVALWKNCDSKKEISFENGLCCVNALYAKHNKTEIAESKYMEIINSLKKIKCIKLNNGNIKLIERLSRKFLNSM